MNEVSPISDLDIFKDSIQEKLKEEEEKQPEQSLNNFITKVE